ncbi:PQQ-binding-like beta-propeller repeat protein [uncultured Jatrophihabitans sp.]|uniref:outer membrane protein assembly factor BamB family protein n=1 Tax=uncultured Jatrophihabitans sp. TaxID=1610747 RepID=UPI0035CADA30
MHQAKSAVPPEGHGSEDESAAALARYRAAQRKPRIVYAAAITVAVAVLAALVAVAYSRGEANNTTLRTAARAPAPVRPEATTPAPQRQWTSSDTAALGVPIAGGIVVTYSSHTMRGRDALTGHVRWSYTRSDRSMCAAIQAGGVAVALYRLSGNCDELTALDAQTGQRRWTRTLDEDGVPFIGTARYQVLGQELMFVSDTAIYAISASGNQYAGNDTGGVDYWVFNHPGCTISNAVLGQSGALISQTCRGQRCAGLTHCRNGSQLLLRPAMNPTARRKGPRRTPTSSPGTSRQQH